LMATLNISSMTKSAVSLSTRILISTKSVSFANFGSLIRVSVKNKTTYFDRRIFFLPANNHARVKENLEFS
jgi:hypothetical protein